VSLRKTPGSHSWTSLTSINERQTTRIRSIVRPSHFNPFFPSLVSCDILLYNAQSVLLIFPTDLCYIHLSIPSIPSILHAISLCISSVLEVLEYIYPICCGSSTELNFRSSCSISLALMSSFPEELIKGGEDATFHHDNSLKTTSAALCILPHARGHISTEANNSILHDATTADARAHPGWIISQQRPSGRMSRR